MGEYKFQFYKICIPTKEKIKRVNYYIVNSFLIIYIKKMVIYFTLLFMLFFDNMIKFNILNDIPW